MGRLGELKRYLEENSHNLERVEKEARVHHKIIKTLYENPSFLGIERVEGEYVNVDIKHKKRRGSVDIVFLSGQDLHLVECKMRDSANSKTKAISQLKLYYEFFHENFGIEPNLYLVYEKKSKLRVERLSIDYLNFLYP